MDVIPDPVLVSVSRSRSATLATATGLSSGPIPPAAMLIGDGFNSALSALRTRAVEFQAGDKRLEDEQLTTPSGSKGQKVAADLREIRTFEELRNTLEIDAAASFDIGMFSSDLSYKFYKSATYTRYSTFVQVFVSVLNPEQVLRRRLLTKTALDSYKRGGAMFVQQCGNRYIYGRQTGGMLSALLQVSSRSSSEFDAHQGKVSAAVTAFASGNATLAQAMTQIAELRDVRYFMLRDGGLGDIPTMNDLIDAARTFPTKVQLDPGEPALAALLTADYNSVENLPGVLPIELGFVEKQKRDLNTLAEWLDEAYEIRGDLRYVSTHIDEFTPESVANLDEVWNANEDVVQKLTNTAAERAQTLENVKLPSRPKGSPLKAVRKQGSIVVAPLPQPTKPITPKQIPIHRKIQCHTVGYGPEEVLYTVPDNLIAAVTVEDVVPDGAGYPSYVLQLGIGSNYSDGSPEARPRGRRHETFNQQFRLLAGEQITLKMAGGGFLTVAIKVVEEL